MSTSPQPARTYNQAHVARRYTAGKRRLSIYWSWSFAFEAQRDPAAMENRFSTMTEVRNVVWPAYEKPEWGAAEFQQGIAGTLELFHRSALDFQQLAGEFTGHPVAVFQRVDQAGFRLPIDERILADTDTLMVFGLDHLQSGEERTPDEVAAIRKWLEREGTCLLLSPHHDVGFTDNPDQRQMEYLHHGDPLVPRQQRFTQYVRSLMKALGVPVHNTWGPVQPGSRGRRRLRRSRLSATSTSRDSSRTSPRSVSIGTCRTTRSPTRTAKRSTCWLASRSSRSVRTRLPRQGTRSSTACCGCRRRSSVPETSYWWT